MLKPEDNEKITRVGPGTPCGELFRRYWVPAAMSSEVPEKDGAPLRVRLLGEDLIAYRDSDGEVGLIDAYCPHRRAPMFFGRNEECGMRCVYHGWKFDRHGDCVDMPSEPAGTPLQARVKIKAYPCEERGGIVWTYMGPREQMPEPPDYEWTRAPATHRHVSKTYEDCNYLQAMEGGLDTAHSSFAHNNNLGDKNELRHARRSPRLDVERTDYGYYYTSHRNLGDGRAYVRIYHFVMPFQQFRGGIHMFYGKKREYPELNGHIWVPIDDTTTWVYNWACAYDQDAKFSEENVIERETFYGRGPDDVIPGTFRLKANRENDYFIDRQMQKTKTFTGHQGHQHAGLRVAGRHGADRRSLAGASGHVRQGDRGHAPHHAGGDQRRRRRPAAARRDPRKPEQHPPLRRLHEGRRRLARSVRSGTARQMVSDAAQRQ